MQVTSIVLPLRQETDPDHSAFYRDVLEALNAAHANYLVGGTYALNCYTGLNRSTKDLDIFIRRQDFDGLAEILGQRGYRVELTYPHWLGKVHNSETFIDLIFSSGNGVAEVDDDWFRYAADTEVLGMPVKISPPEEIMWSKAFIMERERFDGADIAHLVRACGDKLNWRRLFQRFDPHWRVLLAHLVLFGFIYPADRDLVPAWLMEELMARLDKEVHTPAVSSDVCQGTLLSREQYLADIQKEGLRDGRVEPLGNMSPEDTAAWTQAIQAGKEAH